MHLRSPALNLRFPVTTALLLVAIGLRTGPASGAERACTEAFQSLDLVTRIQKLRKGAPVPDSVLLDSRTDRRLLAEQLVRKLAPNNRRIAASGPGTFVPERDTDIMLFFQDDSLDFILEKGFLNYHQAGTTRGDSTLSHRGEVENMLIGRTIENKGYNSFVRERILKAAEAGEPEAKRKAVGRDARSESPFHFLRPKYGYLVIRNREIDIGNVVFRSQYGTTGALLKPAVKRRATWTPTDSLAATERDVYTFGSEPVRAKAYGDAYAKYYFESQIWGDLDISDVEAWLVPANFSASSPFLKKLRATGIPVRRYELMEDHYPSGSDTRRPVIVGD